MESFVAEIESFKRRWRDPATDFVKAHTSGSTGTPKEVSLLKSDMLQSALSTCSFFNITDKSVLCIPLSTDYIAGKMMVVRSEVSGAKLISIKPTNDIGPLLPSSVIDLIAIVPSQIQSLLDCAYHLNIRNVIVGGAPLTTDMETTLQNAPFHCWATYGMTETCSHVALRDITAHEEFFTALPGITFNDDDRGCLVIESDDFSWTRLATNDVVELISRSRFRWIGRIDNVINSGGIKIFPEKVETKLQKVLTGIDFYITSRASAKFGEEVVLVTDNSTFSRDKIIDCAKSVLDRYEVPKDVIFVASMPRTSSGKLRREKY